MEQSPIIVRASKSDFDKAVDQRVKSAYEDYLWEKRHQQMISDEIFHRLKLRVKKKQR